MTLFLTSDETYVRDETNFQNQTNSRTKFSNYILPDFFQDSPFNLALKDVYFDPNFPSLANLDSPHVITVLKPPLNTLASFPQQFQDLSIFKSLFKQGKDDGKVKAPMRVDLEQVSSADECSVMVEIHPRLNFAFSFASAKDISMTNQVDMVKFLNQNFFPLHKEKPLKLGTDGKVTISSKLDLFMSKSILDLLGFKDPENICAACPVLKFPEMFQHKEESTDDLVFHKDSLARLEEKSNFYTNYRYLKWNPPKGEILIDYKMGGKNYTTNVRFELDLFLLNDVVAYDYDQQIEKINFVMREQWLTEVFARVQQRSKIYLSRLRSYWEPVKKYAMENMSGSWGGLITLKRRRKALTISEYHGPNSVMVYKAFSDVLKDAPPILNTLLLECFVEPKVNHISVNNTLSTLFNMDRRKKLRFGASSEISFSQDMNFFKCARSELAKSFASPPYPLQIMTLSDEEITADGLHFAFNTEKDSYYLLKSDVAHKSESILNLQTNHPKLIFVMGNFVNHSFYGSRQEKILNFFPVNQRKNEIIYHNFENPIRLNISTDSNFHINLLDENLKPLKAGFGVPTLLSLKKSKRENMFPVTIISSDPENRKLYPSNQSNSFINKLNIPLLFSDRTQWTVSLRCIAFPKICNIYPEQCHMTIVNVIQGDDVGPPIKISLKTAYINNVDSLVSYLNETIANEVTKYPSGNLIPAFLVEGKRITFNANGYKCSLSRDMMKLLGLTHSYLETSIIISSDSIIQGVCDPDLFIFQPQEIIVLSNIVEESFYAQSRPNILRIIPIPFQDKENIYNYVQFPNQDKIPISFDRISDIKIDIMTRKGDLVSFTNQNDVKVQLEFEKKINLLEI